MFAQTFYFQFRCEEPTITVRAQNTKGQATLCNLNSATEVTCFAAAVNAYGVGAYINKSVYTQFKSKH